MHRRRMTVSLIAAATAALALVSPAHAAESEPGLSSSLSSSPSTADEGALGSLVLSDEGQIAFAVLEALMAVGGAATSGLAAYVKLVPGGEQQVSDFLGQFGIQV